MKTFTRYDNGDEVEVDDSTNSDVTTTRQNLITALELGGYTQRTKRGYMEWDEKTNKLIDASVIGIIALNHGVGLPSLRDFLISDGCYEELFGTSKTLKRVVTFLKKRWKDQLFDPIHLNFYDYSDRANYQGIKIR